MYDIEGTIIEQHGKYHCQLRVWRDDSLSKELVLRGWHKDLTVSDAATTEHDVILDVIVSALHRIAENHEQNIF